MLNQYMELVDPAINARKFYRVWVHKGFGSGAPWKVSSYGRIGSKGTELVVSTHDSEHAAMYEAGQRVGEKLRKGYVAIDHAPGSSPAGLTDKQAVELLSLLGDLDEMTKT